MFPFQKRKPKIITYLECYNYSGCMYRVTGYYSGKNMRYSVEIGKNAQNFRLAEYASLAEADSMALHLLDNGAEPGDFSRKQPCI